MSNENILNLGCAIVEQAAKDYIKAYYNRAELLAVKDKNKTEEKQLVKLDKEMKQIIADLRGNWCNELSNGLAEQMADMLEKDPATVKERLRKNAEDARRKEMESVQE